MALRSIIVLLSLLAAGACATPAPDTLKKIRDTGTVAMGYRESSVPFSFLGPDNKPRGYSVDLCQQVATRLQQQLGLKDLQVKWVPVTPETRLPAVVNGTIDLECGSTTASLSRREQVDFSLLTFVDGGGLLVRREAGIVSLADIPGKRIGIIPGTTTERTLADGLRRGQVTAQIVSVPDHAQGLAALERGAIDAYASDRVILVGLALNAQDPRRLGLVDELFSYEPYGFALRRGDASFRLAVDRALASTYRSGQILEIYARWFGLLGDPGRLLLAMFLLQSLPE